jgi:uncharacterized FlgJ-related protein
MDNRWKRASLMMLIVGVFLLGAIMSPKKVQRQYVKVVKEKVVYKTDPRDKFSEENLKSFILELNLKFPEVVLAQAKLEIANFTSRAFREQNNLFGLTVAKQRPTLAKKGVGRLAHFKSWKECVIDYAFLVADRMRKIKTREGYLAYLDANYDVKGYSGKLLKLI